MNYKIDNLQYCNWSRKIFEINRSAGLDAVHVTIVYHEDFDELQLEIKKWEKLFHENSDLIFLGKNFQDIDKANKENKTAIFFGFQNCSPIEDDINLVEKVHQLGCRFMQLTYNNQSLLATGCYEKVDSGVGMLGLSLYPHHLKDNTNCTLDSFCEMVAKTAEIMDVKKIGIGSDLCLDHPDTVVEWMRNGSWSKSKNYGEGSKNKPGFPKQPDWFLDARGFSNIEKGLKKVGFSDTETHGILGNNWYNFYKSI